MSNQQPITVLPGPSTRDTKGRRYHISPDESRNLAWLNWRSNDCEHGLRPHKVEPDGAIKEIGDLAANTRRKPKGVSSKQWEGR